MKRWLIVVTFLWLPDAIVCPYVTYDRKQYLDQNAGTGGQYDGGDYGGGYESWDYEGKSVYWEYELEKIEPKPVILECFTCHYTKMELHEHGMPNCDDPFHDDGVPVVVCDGLCGKTKSVLGKGEYMVTRSCLPNCQNTYAEESTVECCYGNRCNGATRTNAAVRSSSVALWTSYFVMTNAFYTVYLVVH